MNHPERVEDYLGHIAEAITRATSCLQPLQDIEAFEKNSQIQDAVVRNIEIIGEAVNHINRDRLARSTFELFEIVKGIVDARAQFRSLAEPWADTGTSTGRLMIAVLGGLADVERDLIRTRTAEGRSRAQQRGQHMGRPPRLTEAQQAEARRRRAEGATLAELARSYGVGKSTISRLMT